MSKSFSRFSMPSIKSLALGLLVAAAVDMVLAASQGSHAIRPLDTRSASAVESVTVVASTPILTAEIRQ